MPTIRTCHVSGNYGCEVHQKMIEVPEPKVRGKDGIQIYDIETLKCRVTICTEF